MMIDSDAMVDADTFTESVSVSRRFHGEIHIGGDVYDTVTSALRAAYMEGRRSGQRVTVDPLLREVTDALSRAEAKHAPMRGPHEGYAVILEEMDELWTEVKQQSIDPIALRKEACHVAAMGLRFLKDVCIGGNR